MRLDPHSYADGSQPAIAEVDWRARVDFASRTLDAEAVLVLASASEGPLDLDTRDLAIRDAIDERGKPIEWMLDPPEPILGARLRLTLPANTRRIAIRYSTSPRASALQWLTPAQTAGGREPFLFSQAQAIHARSFLPIADTPARRVRLRAALDVPAALRALVAAGFVGREVRGERAIERYEMPQPIPPYLIAFAVGALESRELGPRSRAWAEREVVEAAAREFDGV